MRRRANWLGRIVGVVAPAALAASAWAQDYTATNSSGLLEARPAGATQLNIHSSTTPASVVVDLPFVFPCYGKTVTTATVCVSGFLVAGGTVPTGSYSFNNTSMHGQNTTTGAFPYTQTGYGGAGPQNVDGLIAPFWLDWNLGNGAAGTGYVWTWTTGSAPNRHFVVHWENGKPASAPSLLITTQVQLFEGSGRIVFAYASANGYGNTSYVCGIDSAFDARYVVPSGVNNAANNSFPRVDVIFDPTLTAVTGTLHYDKIVSDAGGIGNSVLGDRPLAGFPIRLQRTSDGFVYASGTTAADGSFSFTGYALPSSTPSSVVVSAQNAACNVSATVGGPTTTWTAAASVSLAGETPLGVVTLGLAADPNGSLRSAFNVALTCGAARDWAAARTSAGIPQLGVVFDDLSSAATNYLPASMTNAAALYVAGKAAANPDAWDDGVVTKTYARHLIASISVPQTTPSDYRFDAVTDSKNAFAEAFCCWLWAAVSGATKVIDGKSSSSATVYDLESPSITVAKGRDVAGCVAGALFDLLDPANEAIDPIDGSSVPERVLQLVDASASALDTQTFLQAWGDAGYGAQDVTRCFIGNKVLADDASEPNDSAAEPTPLGPVGVVRSGLTLNRVNEDWFSMTTPAAADALQVDVKYDQFSTGAAIVLEIRDETGVATLATGALRPLTGAIHAVTGPVAAGTYLVRVGHVSGNAIPAYVVQTCVPLTLSASPVRDWTVGRAYDFPLGAAGGIAPFSLTTPSGAMPAGLSLDAVALRAHGAPSKAGSFPVTIRVTDGGDPANFINSTQVVTIHDALRIPVAPFVGFAAGKTVDAVLPTTGGTAPFTLSMASGALPAGLAFAPNSLHVTGTAALGPSVEFALDGVDVAGSADHVATRGVVCVQMTGKKIPAELVAGTDACGWWFDAVAGSTVTFSVATGKGKPKRALTGALLAPSRALVTTGKIVGKNGSIAGSKLICPQSGRYCFVASSIDAGAATQLLGTLTVKLPTSGKGSFKTFAPTATTTLEIGAVPGSTAIVKFTGDKKATLTAKVVSVTDPNGVLVNFPPLVKPSALGGTLTLPLPVGGTWTIVLGATSGNGTSGKLTYSTTIKQAKGATYVAE